MRVDGNACGGVLLAAAPVEGGSAVGGLAVTAGDCGGSTLGGGGVTEGWVGDGEAGSLISELTTGSFVGAVSGPLPQPDRIQGINRNVVRVESESFRMRMFI